MTRSDSDSALNRRTLVKGAIASGAALAATPVFAPAVRAAKTLKLGYVSPQTGPLAAFAEADKFIIDSFLKATKDAGLSYEVVVKDSQSNPNRAAEVAKELIVDDKVNLMLVASTPETTNPVSTTCEAEEMPCISTVAPWQPWFIGQQANPAQDEAPVGRLDRQRVHPADREADRHAEAVALDAIERAVIELRRLAARVGADAPCADLRLRAGDRIGGGKQPLVKPLDRELSRAAPRALARRVTAPR